MTLVAFRVDASPEIGTGHLARCLALADELRARGAHCHFIGNLAPPAMQDAVAKGGHTLHAASRADDVEEVQRTLSRLSERPRWLVVDHYGIDARTEVALGTAADGIFVIDDLADRAHDCELLLDQTPGAEERHRPTANARRTLLGPRFALLRPQFGAARLRARRRDGTVRRVLVHFGGADPDNRGARVLGALRRMAAPVQVTVIAGPANRNIRSLERECIGIHGSRLIAHTEQIAEEMEAADLAIGAGGVSALERCAVGLPALVWAIEPNQKPGVEALARIGAVIAPTDESIGDEAAIATHLAALLANPALVNAVGARARALCDGAGAVRVASQLLPPKVVVRRASRVDCDEMLEWRNHLDIRRQALDPRPIAPESHREWFARAISDPRRALLIAEDESGPVGVLRYDIADAAAEVSIYLRPGFGGRGLGRAVLEAGEHWLREAHPAVGELRARVVPSNETSERLFSNCGYERGYAVYRKTLQA